MGIFSNGEYLPGNECHWLDMPQHWTCGSPNIQEGKIVAGIDRHCCGGTILRGSKCQAHYLNFDGCRIVVKISRELPYKEIHVTF